jgi:hypothetical protein
VARSAVPYRGGKTAKDAAVIGSRNGYFRIRIFLGRDGHRMRGAYVGFGERRAFSCRQLPR